MEVILFFGFISALVCGITSTMLANSKGGHALGWFCIGFFLNILGIAILVASPYNQENLDKKGVNLYSAVMDADLRDLWYACSKQNACEAII